MIEQLEETKDYILLLGLKKYVLNSVLIYLEQIAMLVKNDCLNCNLVSLNSMLLIIAS